MAHTVPVMSDQYKRRGTIPPFGNWDRASELPITQYFQCARQTGLIRYSSSSGESEPCTACGDLYAVDYNRTIPPPRKTRGREREREKRCANVNGKKQGKVFDVSEPPRRLKIVPTAATASKHLGENDVVSRPRTVLGSSPASARPPHGKPVDEDLYKIPRELLHHSKRKTVLGFFSRCMVPAACVS